MDIIARRQFAPLYIWLEHYFSGGVSSASSCKKEIYDSVGRASDGRSLYGGGLRYFQSVASHPEYLTGL